MAQTNPGFEVIEGGAEQPQPAPQEPGVAIAMLTIALKALSQRALVAATDLFSLLTVASAFWLWYSIPSPNQFQLVALGLYGLLVLAINVIVRRK